VLHGFVSRDPVELNRSLSCVSFAAGTKCLQNACSA
jgi:hypothetical protein